MYSNLSIVKILWRYKNRETLTEQELSELRVWLSASTLHEDLFDDLSNTQKWDQDIAERLSRDGNATWKKIQERVEELDAAEFSGKRKTGWWRYGAAAALLLVLFCGIYYLKTSRHIQTPDSRAARFKNDLLPASGTARLTLSDGSVILLDSAKTGELIKQGHTMVIKKDSGQLDYSSSGNHAAAEQFNTLTVPRGRQYQLILPDGSKVWLNAASSLRYPVAFTGADRTVELKGEAYFEVVNDKEKPFQVRQAGSLIRVLGTHFNVCAYGDEPESRTTVLEGSVVLQSGQGAVVIKPGEEARLDHRGKISLLTINPEQSIAWKAKLFWFQGTSFEQIMRELSRWYDIEVVYDGKANQTFTGILPCNLPLANLLSILEKGGNVLFSIDGKKVTVKS